MVPQSFSLDFPYTKVAGEPGFVWGMIKTPVLGAHTFHLGSDAHQFAFACLGYLDVTGAE